MHMPSKYQSAIYEKFERTSDSLLIEAVAGSGKTSTLVGLSEIIARAFPAQKAAFLAFNRGIANELQRRISAPNVASMTLHAAGWASWRRSLGMDSNLCEVDGGKVGGIMREREVMTWQENQKYRESTYKLVSAAKGLGIVPRGTFAASGEYAGLVEDTDAVWEGLIEHYALDDEDCSVEIVRRVLALSIARAGDVCDFDDMLYMPVIAGVPFDKFDIVLVDEAQDLSGIQHEMIERMGAGRVVAVGDRKQSIYGFRGAHTDSMDRLASRFNMTCLPLSVSYRCPRAVVQHVRRWVSQIEASETAEDGYVGEEGTDWQGQCEIAIGARCINCGCAMTSDMKEYVKDCPCGCYPHCVYSGISKWHGGSNFRAGDAILCRNTRPLVAAAFRLIRRRIRCVVLGRDIGKGLTQLVKKSRISPGSPRGEFADWLARYEEKECARLRKRQEHARIGALRDRCDTLWVFIAELPEDSTVGDLARSIETLFDDQEGAGRVTLATIHKAKGLEWERVFVLDAGELMPSPYARQSWERDQERNLMYVAATRARRELRYIRSEEVL